MSAGAGGALLLHLGARVHPVTQSDCQAGKVSAALLLLDTRVGEVPSAAMVHTSGFAVEPDVNTMRRPVGDQTGLLLGLARLVRRTGDVPSALLT